MKVKVLIGLLSFSFFLAKCSSVKESNSEEQARKMELGKELINKSDCNSCHQLETKIIGPSYLEIAEKYKNNDETIQKLAAKIIDGGSGVWGDIPMIAHADLDDNDAQTMVLYIFSLLDEK